MPLNRYKQGLLTTFAGDLTDAFIEKSPYLCILDITNNKPFKPSSIMILLSFSIPLTSLPTLFVEGGPIGMSVLTVLLVFLLFAAWKAPSWVKEIGAAALAFSILSVSLSWYNAASAVEACNGNISPSLLWAGLKCCIVTLCYGLIIYLVSLAIRLIRKPRL